MICTAVRSPRTERGRTGLEKPWLVAAPTVMPSQITSDLGLSTCLSRAERHIDPSDNIKRGGLVLRQRLVTVMHHCHLYVCLTFPILMLKKSKRRRRKAAVQERQRCNAISLQNAFSPSSWRRRRNIDQPDRYEDVRATDPVENKILVQAL